MIDRRLPLPAWEVRPALGHVRLTARAPEIDRAAAQALMELALDGPSGHRIIVDLTGVEDLSTAALVALQRIAVARLLTIVGSTWPMRRFLRRHAIDALVANGTPAEGLAAHARPGRTS